jgi:competence protein ComEA
MRNRPFADWTPGGLLLLLFLLVPSLLTSVSRSSAPDKPPCDETVFVQVSGKVRSPGVYGFCQPPDIEKLLSRAGGLTSGTKMHLPINDILYHSGICVDLRSEGDTTTVHIREMSAFYKASLGIPISINKETPEGLTVVPGFGPKIARAIVRERAKRGAFKSLDEILSIPGIGPNLFRKASRYLTL